MTETERFAEQVKRRDYRHIVCDLDGTLTRLHLPWQRGMQMLYHSAPHQIRRDLQQGFERGDSYGTVLNGAVERYETFLPTLLAWSRDFEAGLTSQQPYDDLVSVLRSCVAEGRRLSIWTSNTERAARWALGEIGILPHCYTVVTRDDERLLKPSPEGWSHIYDGGALGDYVFMGDSPDDEQAAMAIGIDYFAIRHFAADVPKK